MDFVKINISNSKNDHVAFEIKYPKDITVGQLKNKLEIITGGCASSMKLELHDGDRFITSLNKEDSKLLDYPIKNGMRVHVIDSFTNICTEIVDKFELTEEQYAQKKDTVRDFLKKNRLGKFNAKEAEQKNEKQHELNQQIMEKASKCVIGARCQVSVPGHPLRRGTIKYNGLIEGKKSILIGVQYDEPLGKNDGSIDGKSYFVCPPNYGSFVSPLAVEVGDYPPEDWDNDDEL